MCIQRSSTASKYAILIALFLMVGCGTAEFPGRQSPFSGASDVPFVTTYNFGFRVGFSPVSDAEGSLVIISAGDLLNFVSAANITQRPGMGVISGVVRGFSGTPAENATLILTDASGTAVGDIFYNGLGGTPDFVQTVGTTSTGQFTIFNVPPGEVFLKAVHGARGNARLRAFANSVSLISLPVVRIGAPTQAVVLSIGEINQTLPNVPIGVSVVGNLADQDADGITNDLDLCPGTGPLNPVDERGCAEGQSPGSPTDIGLLAVTDPRGLARFTLNAEGDYLIKLFDDRVDHTDTFHELNTNRAQLVGTQSPDITSFMVVYSNDHIKLFQNLAGVFPLPGRGMIFGTVKTSDGTPLLQTVIQVTNAAGQSIQELGGSLVYTNLSGDPDPSLNRTTTGAGFMVFNVPIEPMFITATANIFRDGPFERHTGTAMVQPISESVYGRDLIMFGVPLPDSNNPIIPPVFTVSLSGQVKRSFEVNPVAGAQVSALGMLGPLATTDSGGNYTIARAIDPAQTRPLLAGVRYVFKVSGPDNSSSYQDTYQELFMGADTSSTPLGDFNLFDKDTLKTYADSVGMVQDPTKGILIGTLVDLATGRAGAGISVTARDALANVVGKAYYFDEFTGLPRKDLLQSTQNGKYIVFNVPPGMVSVGVNSQDDSGNAIAQVFAGGVTIKNIGVNNAPSPVVQVRGTLKDLSGIPVEGISLSALGGDLRMDQNGRVIPLQGISGQYGSFSFEQSSFTQQVILARKDPEYFPTYNFDFGTFENAIHRAELTIIARQDIERLSAQIGIQQDVQKGIILGEIRVPDFQVLSSFCADGNPNGACGPTQPVAVVADYFNEDLALDLAVLQRGDPASSTPGLVSIYFGNGDGTFRYSESSTVGLGAIAMESGDLNQDGAPDLVVLNQDSVTFSVLVGSRTGRFLSNPPQYAINASKPSAIALVDHNRDRLLDLLITDHDSNRVYIFLGDGRGGFRELVQDNPTIPVPLPPCNPVALAVVTLDTDVLPDWVVACDGTNGLAVLRSRTGFQVSQLPDLRPTGLTLADFNGDGAPDIAVIGEDLDQPNRRGKLAVVMSNGGNVIMDKNSAGEPLFEAPLRKIALADFDFDPFLDLLVTEEGASSAKVLFGRSGGRFDDPLPIAVGQSLSGLVVSDFDRNGTSDFVVADEKIHQLSVVLSKDILADHHPQVESIDFTAKRVGQVNYLTADGTVTTDSQQGDGRFLIFNVPPGVTTVRTTNGGSGNKTIMVYPDSLSYVKIVVQRGVFGNVLMSVEGTTVDAIVRPIGDVDIEFLGSEAVTFSAPLLVQNGSIKGGANYAVFLEVNSEYIVRLNKVGGGGAPPVPGDFDFDSIPDNLDDCPGAFNPDQTDTDGDNIGDVCDPNPAQGVRTQ